MIDICKISGILLLDILNIKCFECQRILLSKNKRYLEAINMFEKLVDLIASELSVSKDTITQATHLQNDLGADSLDAVELIMSIEDAFDIQIPDDAAQNMKTVGDIVTYLESLV